MMRYLAVIHKDNDSDYGVTIPDLPGCFSAGSTMDEALDMAREAILCHIEGLLADEEMIPVPLSIEVHQQNPDYRDGVLVLIEIDPSAISGEVRRINITMPERILARLDRYVAVNGGNRSAVLTEAAFNLTMKDGQVVG
jgi:predicted RNase H-like HicB family nuclease